MVTSWWFWHIFNRCQEFQHIFNMHWNFQHDFEHGFQQVLNFSTLFFSMVFNIHWNFQHTLKFFNTVFNMHSNFQHGFWNMLLKHFNFQHGLKIKIKFCSVEKRLQPTIVLDPHSAIWPVYCNFYKSWCEVRNALMAV